MQLLSLLHVNNVISMQSALAEADGIKPTIHVIQCYFTCIVCGTVTADASKLTVAIKHVHLTFDPNKMPYQFCSEFSCGRPQCEAGWSVGV